MNMREKVGSSTSKFICDAMRPGPAYGDLWKEQRLEKREARMAHELQEIIGVDTATPASVEVVTENHNRAEQELETGTFIASIGLVAQYNLHV